MLEEISQNIAKFNIHALVIIGGFEVRSGRRLCFSSAHSKWAEVPETRSTEKKMNLRLLFCCRRMLEASSWCRLGRNMRKCAFPLWLSLPPYPTTSLALTLASALTLPWTPSPPLVAEQQIYTHMHKHKLKRKQFIVYFLVCFSADLWQDQAVCSRHQAPRVYRWDYGWILWLLSHHGRSGCWGWCRLHLWGKIRH